MVVITHLWRSTGRTGAEYVQGAAQNSPLVFVCIHGCCLVDITLLLLSVLSFFFLTSLSPGMNYHSTCFYTLTYSLRREIIQKGKLSGLSFCMALPAE